MSEPIEDLVVRAASVTTVAELAGLLRQLRRREARERPGRALTYRELADRAGWPVASVGAYLAGMRVPPTERFDELLLVLGVRPHEHGPLATARDRVDDAPRPKRLIAGGGAASPHAALTTTARTLPAAPRVFTGRAGALARLDGAVAATGAACAVVVTAVAGMGGVGKTALAVHWGHSTIEQYPGGQLYVNLRGYDPGEPLSTLDALGVLLSGLGTPPAAMPADERGRLSLYRSILGGQRALVLLDNARSSAQVQPLLPPAPCLALITSRDDLAGLTAEGDVRRLRLDVFAEGEAITLLRQLIGERADHHPEAVRTLAKRCGYLPLALRVVAELAASRPDTPLPHLVDELQSDLDASGLGAFNTGDLRSDLRAVITWSVRCLPDPAARALRLLGLLPGTDVDEYGLAALADVTPADAAVLLTALRNAHLVEPWPPGRYSMHDLVRAYARESAERGLDADDRQAATTRLLDYYLSAAMATRRTLSPASNLATGRDRAVPTIDMLVPELNKVDVTTAWLEAERGNIVAACVHASIHGWPAHAVATAVELWAFFDDANLHEAITMHTAALLGAKAPGAGIDPRDHARLLAALALAHFRLGDFDNATVRAEESIAVNRHAGNETGTILALTVLGSVYTAQGRFPEVFAVFEQALEHGKAHGPAAQIMPLANLGELNLMMERYEAAVELYEQAAAIAVAVQLHHETAEAQRGIAEALVRLGRCTDAVAIAEGAVEVGREYGFPISLVAMLDTLAQAYRESGMLPEAIEHLAEAIQLCREIADPSTLAQVLNTFGETYNHAGDYEVAHASHEEALELAARAPNRKERTRALVGLGDAHAALGDLDLARDLWRQALDEYTDMGLPAAARVAARLR